MELFRDGNERAFEQLLQRTERRVFNFIFRLVRNRELANDLLQETFLRVVKGAAKYTQSAKFTTWVFTIARNLCMDEFRRQSHRRHKSLDQNIGGEEGGRTLMDVIEGSSPDAYTRAAAGEIRGRVEEALAQLSEEQREVFVLRQFMELPFKEIAEVVGIPENTVKSRMRYALENLRLMLADYLADPSKATGSSGGAS
jgi:RNA polymerase sigma-70 factor (ECF subfamily)